MDRFITNIGSAIASLDGNTLLINLVLQISVLAFLALLANYAARKHASARYNILFPAMLGLVFTTVVSIWMQGSGSTFFHINLPDRANTLAGSPVLELELPALDLSEASTDTVATRSQETAEPGIVSRVLTYSPSVPVILTSLWIAGFLLTFLGLLRSLHQVEKIAGFSRTPTPEEHNSIKLSLNSSDSNARIRIRISNSVPSPVLAGLWNPVLLIPSSYLIKLSTAQLREILIHELAHIQRRDCLANFVQKLILCLFWFHPLVHLMDRQVSKAREEICDNYVLQQDSALDYGETLLAVTSLSRDSLAKINAKFNARGVNVGIISPQWKLEDRIRELLDTSRSQTVKLSTQSQSLLLLSLITLSVFISGCQLQAAEQRTPSNRSVELQSQNRTESQTLAEELARRQAAELEQRNANLESALVREQLARSLSEMQSLLEDAQTETQQRDLTELMQRIFTELENRLGENSAAILGEVAFERFAGLAQQIDSIQNDREELMRSLIRLQSALDLGTPDPQPVARNQREAPAPDNTRDRRQAPTPDNDTGILSERTMRVASEVQELMSPSEDGVEPDLSGAKQMLDSYRERYWERLNDFEKSTLLNFYTNYWLTLEDYPEALNTFEELLTIENLRDDTRLRTLRSLGQLYMAEERWEQAITRYQDWREQSPEEDVIIFRGLSYSNYQLERYADALPYWQQYMSFSTEIGDELERDDYAYLNGLYFNLEMFEEALENTKEMIVLFNDPTDWRNLRAVQSRLGITDPQAQIESVPGPEDSPADIATPAEQVAESITSRASFDSSYLPLVSIRPRYPEPAARDGIEGWALVSFTVNEEGRVIADTITVQDAEPANIFDQAAIQAAQRFLYNPREQNGVPVSVDDVQYLFRWSLNNDA